MEIKEIKNSQYTLRVPRNELGRDFVCGDLHGCYKRLLQWMEHVNFDKTKDRLFSVGDLVDRGPQNVECLMLLNEPWFFAVQGNHEQLMHDGLFDGPYGYAWNWNGGSWGLKFKGDQDELGETVRTLALKAATLPYLITVERQDGKLFHILHAELGQTTPVKDTDLADEARFKEIAFAQTMDGDHIIWGRFIYYTLYNSPLEEHDIEKFRRTATYHKMGGMFNDELSHIYSGHTIMRQPVRFCGQTNIDTGAFLSIWPEVLPYGKVTQVPAWAGLTVTEPLTDTFWHASEAGVKEIQPVVL